MSNWFPIALIIVLIGLLAIAIFLAWRAPAEGLDQNHTDPVPVRLGVSVFGAVVLACVIGLMNLRHHSSRRSRRHSRTVDSPTKNLDRYAECLGLWRAAAY